MTSQTGEQTIKIHILPNISWSKGNQTLKFGELIKYNKRNIFFKNSAENEAGRLVPHFFLFPKKASYEVKVIALQLSLIYFDSPEPGMQ